MIQVSDELHSLGLKAIGEAIVTVANGAEALARLGPELHAARRELLEHGNKRSAAVLGLAIGILSDVAVRLAQMRMPLRRALTDFRACNEDLTPINPHARRDSEAAFKAATEHAEKAARSLKGE